MNVDAEDRAFFEAHGWLIVRNVISPERLSVLRSTLARLMAEEAHEVVPGVRQRINVCKTDPACHRFLFQDNEIRAIAKNALGCEALQLQQDLVMLKPPGATQGSVGWHQDHAYARYLQPARAIGVRLALDTEDEESGCMVVLDGSHAWGYCLDLDERNWFLEGERTEFLPDTVASNLESARVPILLEPGDVSVHHCLTVHASLRNQSVHERMTLIHHLFDAACVFDPTNLTGPMRQYADAGYFPTDAHGHLSTLLFPGV